MAANLQTSADYAVGPIIDAEIVEGDGRVKAVKITLPGFTLLGTDGTAVDSTTMAAAIGATDDAAWNGSDADATVISLLKAIALNTTP